MPQNAPSEESIFALALEKPMPAERAAFLEGACGGDPLLRARIEGLLKSHEEAGTFLRQPPSAAGGTLEYRPILEAPGQMIGRYKLLQQIGEGGMGVVYMADQERPVHRRVALKIIKPGMDSGQVVARFEAERQALAMMDHQNIAKVLDAGTTEAGRPYFVMELVKGVPITEYCDANRLSPRERLELFVPVCRAIQHAHQKGIIHRDIKPSNVLVSLYDGKPVPKVIDFGVAKAIEQRLTERTMFTQHGAVVGTLEYMSPEQAENSALDVDTRSDVYSLGVLLYELLTGTTPMERATLRGAAYVEILRRIKEEEPPRPSTRLSESRATLASISAQRMTEPSKLAGLMRGELDWIVMKALEKDRSRRYDTAVGFARDIERYLEDEAVEACPPSAMYRLRKFVNRHRAAMVTATAFATLLVAAAVVSAWQAARATRAEHRARAERDRAVAAEVHARAESDKASRSAAESWAVLKFLQDDMLAAARPVGFAGGLGRDATIRQAVEAAEPKIDAAFKDQPTVEASVRKVLGETYRYLGEHAPAVRQHERAVNLRTSQLGREHPDTLASQADLARALAADSQFNRAIPLFQMTVAAQAARLGPSHPDTLASQADLAQTHQLAGCPVTAIPLLEKTVAAQESLLGPDHPVTITSKSSLGVAYALGGHHLRAIPLLERTVAAQESRLGPDHPDTITGLNGLGSAYYLDGQFDRAIPLLERTVAARMARLGPDHPDTLANQANLAMALRDAGQLDRAIPMLKRILETDSTRYGAGQHQLLSDQLAMAEAYLCVGRLDLAVPLLKETLDAATAKFSPYDRVVGTTRRVLARAYQEQGKLAQAESQMRELVLRLKILGTQLDPSLLADALSDLGECLLKQRRWAEAEAQLRESLKLMEMNRLDKWETSDARSRLGGSLLGQERYAEAEPLLLSGYEKLKAVEARIPAGFKACLAEASERVVALYDAWGKPEKADEWRSKLGLKRPELPDDVFARP